MDPKVLSIHDQRVCVAVAVKAITLTLGGSMLRSSPRRPKSSLKESPLQLNIGCAQCKTHIYDVMKIIPFFDTVCLINYQSNKTTRVWFFSKHVSPPSIGN